MEDNSDSSTTSLTTAIHLTTLYLLALENMVERKIFVTSIQFKSLIGGKLLFYYKEITILLHINP